MRTIWARGKYVFLSKPKGPPKYPYKEPTEYIAFSEYNKAKELLSFAETYLKTRAAHDPIVRNLMSEVYGRER